MSPVDLDELVELISPDAFQRDSILGAIKKLPEDLWAEYAGKLYDSHAAGGTIHELRLIGLLSGREVDGFRCLPFPESLRCDCLLTLADQDVELEITADIRGMYDDAVGRVCRRIERYLLEQYSASHLRIEIGNAEGFPELVEGSTRCLDEGDLYKQVLEHLSKLLSDDGDVVQAPDATNRLGPVVLVEKADRTSVRQTSFVLPGGNDVEQVRRKVRGKLEKGQWTGSRPAVLAVILDAWPHADILDRSYDNISTDAFSSMEHLSALVAVPCNATERCRVLLRPQAAGGSRLGVTGSGLLTAGFDFIYGA